MMQKSTNMQFYYPNMDKNFFWNSLMEKEINQALAYMVTFKEYKNLSVLPKPHSIEISNGEITLIIILYSGFEKEEYEAVRNQSNLHLVSFSAIIPTMVEFKKMDVKIIDKMALFWTVISRSSSKMATNLQLLIEYAK